MDLVNVKNLQISYNDSVILDDISFSIKQGEYVIIVGKNGSGKSTLLKTIVGLKKASKGIITLNLPNDEYSYLEQVNTKNNDFPITCYEVILSGMQKPKKLFYKKSDYERANEMLKMLKIESLRNKKISEISGGQKQRVLIARSLAKSPKLLILDEPLSRSRY
ncbi:MAG: ATP-binding cassette domain-containing protein [Clostridia bacterium]|nr:ATP-binding cassette domain-containing protein [Clostridia bacterium]